MILSEVQRHAGQVLPEVAQALRFKFFMRRLAWSRCVGQVMGMVLQGPEKYFVTGHMVAFIDKMKIETMLGKPELVNMLKAAPKVTWCLAELLGCDRQLRIYNKIRTYTTHHDFQTPKLK